MESAWQFWSCHQDGSQQLREDANVEKYVNELPRYKRAGLSNMILLISTDLHGTAAENCLDESSLRNLVYKIFW